jgi:hypothetical protein
MPHFVCSVDFSGVGFGVTGVGEGAMRAWPRREKGAC